MNLPLVVKVDQLATTSPTNVRIVDVRPLEQYQQAHMPGAHHVAPKLLNSSKPPVGGLLPDAHSIESLLSSIGYQPGDHLVAYDNGAETPAARFVWVMHAYGVFDVSWLDGGVKAWQRAGQPLNNDAVTTDATQVKLAFTPGNVLSVDETMAELNQADVTVLDVRNNKEFAGTDDRTEQSPRGGHVPGAIHNEWVNAFDENGLLKPDDVLLSDLNALGFTQAQKVLVYCKTHQRSALSYVVLKHLGFDNVAAIDGAWSAWSNHTDAPIES